MLTGLLALLLCQLAGETLVRLTGLPLPGPVAGMLILLAVLAVRRPDERSPVLQAADGLLTHLQLLFVPVGVGIITAAAIFRDAPVPLLGGLVGAWVVGIVVTAVVATVLLRLQAALVARWRAR